jgi:hypothetical protein
MEGDDYGMFRHTFEETDKKDSFLVIKGHAAVTGAGSLLNDLLG